MRAAFSSALLALCALTAAVSTGCDDDNLGDTCGSDRDCDGICAEGEEFPDGMCTFACERELDCPEGWTCASPKGGVCMQLCTSSGACRDDFGKPWVCREISLKNSSQRERVCIGD